MTTTPCQIDKWLSEGNENENLEFKEQYDKTKLLKGCVAIANEGGGKFVVGVSDKLPRSVKSTDALGKPSEIDAIKTEIFDTLKFRINVEVCHHGGRILVFHIPGRPRGTAYHYEGRYLMRCGSSQRSMSEDRLREIFAEASERSAARHVVPTFPETSRPPALDKPIGRQWLADTLASACSAGQHVLIRGGPGIGKTTLISAVANHRLAKQRFRERRCYVNLSAAGNVQAMESAIHAQVIGLESKVSFDRTCEVLGAAPTLLILDHLETPWEPAERRMDVEDRLAHLASIPGVAILAGIIGAESPHRVLWWSEPSEPLNALDLGEAKTLFLRIAPQAGADKTHLKKLLEELGGVPLGITLVAHRARDGEPLSDLWTEFKSKGLAVARRRGVPAGRESSLEASFEMSWNSPRLQDEGRLLFPLLGQLPLGMADDDREAVLKDLKKDADEAAYQLCAVGLAFKRDGRIDLRPPVRTYARTRRPPDEAATNAWCGHYLDMARENGQRIGDSGGAASVEKLGQEFANMEAAFRTATKEPLRSIAIAAVYGLALFMLHTNAGTASVFEPLLEGCKAEGNKVGEARCRLGRGIINRIHAEYDEARREYDAALSLATTAKSDVGEAECHERLGVIAECHERLGVIALDLAQYDEARKYFRQALDFYREVGNDHEVAYCLWRLAETSVVQFEDQAAWWIEDTGRSKPGSPDDVRKTLERGLQLYKKCRVESGMANCLYVMAEIDRFLGEYELAKAKYERARDYYTEGHKLGHTNCRARFGDLAEAASRRGEARTCWEEALSCYMELDEPIGIAEMHLRLARVNATNQADHVRSAANAWRRAKRQDLIDKYFTLDGALR
jgi:tetratricopeptide (TPR) repeat protein